MNGFKIKSTGEALNVTDSFIKAKSKEESTLDIVVSVMNVIDSDGDMVMPGAFDRTIRERGPEAEKSRIKHLWQHKTFEPIGIPVEMKEQEVEIRGLGKYPGLVVKTKFDSSQFSQDKFTQHLEGIITEFSYGYEIMKWERSETHVEGKVIEYTKLLELKMWEYSSVTWGANYYTQIMKQLQMGEEKAITELENRFTILSGAMKSSRYNDDDKELFELELLQIKELVFAFMSRPSGDVSSGAEPSGDVRLEKEAMQMINDFRKQLNF